MGDAVEYGEVISIVYAYLGKPLALQGCSTNVLIRRRMKGIVNQLVTDGGSQAVMRAFARRE